MHEIWNQKETYFIEESTSIPFIADPSESEWKNDGEGSLYVVHKYFFKVKKKNFYVIKSLC